MNYGLYFLARVLAGVAVAFLLIGIQSCGVAMREKRSLPAYGQLGAAVSDQGRFLIDWWLWPPQPRLSGRYRGFPFHYEKVNRNAIHLLVECRPRSGWEAHRSRPAHLHSRITNAILDQLFPGWIAAFASRGPVPWTKRSLDRRPLGLGSAPGIDLYRQSVSPFNAQLLRSDLEALETFCSDVR